jgi:hypothetical protein
MMTFLTGAVMYRDDSGNYCVEYHEQRIAECQYRDEAIMLALDRARLQEKLLQKQQQPLPI